MSKEKTAEQKTTFAETGKVELNIRVPNIFPKNVKHIVHNLRRALENCAALRVLNEFMETKIAEYKEGLE